MTDQPTRIFDERFKARQRVIASATLVLASAAPFAAGLMAITYIAANPNGWFACFVTLSAFAIAIGLTWHAQDRLALLGNGALRASLHTRLDELREVAGCRDDALFVGFSPGDDIRMWSGETDLDIGYLCVADHGIVFMGERFSWSLSKGRVDQIDLTPAPAGPRRIVVRWHAPREPRRAFTLESREAKSLTEAMESTVELFRALRKWSLTEPLEAAQPAPAFGNPPVGDHGGKPVHELASGSCAVLGAMTSAIIVTTWYLAGQMLADGFYCHAILWAGFVFVGGAVFTRCLLQYLQSAEKPRRKRQPQRRNRQEPWGW